MRNGRISHRDEIANIAEPEEQLGRRDDAGKLSWIHAVFLIRNNLKHDLNLIFESVSFFLIAKFHINA